MTTVVTLDCSLFEHTLLSKRRLHVLEVFAAFMDFAVCVKFSGLGLKLFLEP